MKTSPLVRTLAPETSFVQRLLIASGSCLFTTCTKAGHCPFKCQVCESLQWKQLFMKSSNWRVRALFESLQNWSLDSYQIECRKLPNVTRSALHWVHTQTSTFSQECSPSCGAVLDLISAHTSDCLLLKSAIHEIVKQKWWAIPDSCQRCAGWSCMAWRM